MSRLYINEQASAQVKNTSPAQLWFFVCDSRSPLASVVEAYISADTAKRRARLIGGVVRVGRVEQELASKWTAVTL